MSAPVMCACYCHTAPRLDSSLPFPPDCCGDKHDAPPAPAPPDARLAEIDWPDYPAPLPLLPNVDQSSPDRAALTELARRYDALRSHVVDAEKSWEQEATAVRRDARDIGASFLRLARVEADARTIAALRGDAERVAWLSAGNCAESVPEGYYLVWSGALNKHFRATSLREAIDAAMRAGAGGQ